MKRSLKWKVALIMWLLAALCTLAASTLTLWLLFENENRRLDEKLEAAATSLLSLKITNYSGLEGFQQLENVIRSALNLEEKKQIIHVYTRRGKLMLKSPSDDQPILDFSPIEIPLFLDEKPTFHELVTPDRRRFRLLVTPYQAKNGKDYFLHIAMPNPQLEDIAKATVREGIILFITLSIAAFIISQILAHKLLEPVGIIAKHLKTLNPSTAQDWPSLSVADRSDYLQDIALGINTLSRRVKSSLYNLSRTRRYLAHELGNPLTILMGEAQYVLSDPKATVEDYRAVLTSSLQELDRIQNVVETISKIARKEKNMYKPVPQDLVKWINENIASWNKTLLKDIEWQEPNFSIMVTFDPNLLFRIMDNLFRNVRRHAPGSQMTRLTVINEEMPCIILEDQGPGMPKELLKSLNDGLTRDSRFGIGLGLCLEIASICHFNLHFENRAERGLKVTICMEKI